jgi:hypothetical protein
MDPQVIRFTKVINHLISLTTRDEYGSSRSRGIETYSEFAEELNAEGILATKGEWTENSLKLHISRLKNQYGIDYLIAQCDFEMIDRCAWEYSSGTVHEEVQRRKKCGAKRQAQKITKSCPVIGYDPNDGQNWKESELIVLQAEERKIRRKMKKMKKRKSPDTF